MSKLFRAAENVTLVGAILLSVALWSVLGADEGEKKADPDRDCVNNLKQLGVYAVMYVSKYGSDRDYSGPGQKLFSDLFELPDRKSSICGENFGLLVCKRCGDDKILERLQKGEWEAMSYECWEGQVSDGGTRPDVPIAWDRTACHDGKRNVLFFDGHVSTMTDEELEAAKEKQKK